MRIRQRTFEPTCVCLFKQPWVQNRLLVDTQQPSPYLTACSLQLLVSDCDTVCSHTISVDNWRTSRALSEQIRLSAPVRNPQFCNRRSDDPLRPAVACAGSSPRELTTGVYLKANPLLSVQHNCLPAVRNSCVLRCYRPASGQLCKAV